MGENFYIPRHLEMRFSDKFIIMMALGIFCSYFAIYLATQGIFGHILCIRGTTPQISVIIFVSCFLFFSCLLTHALTWSLILDNGDISIETLFFTIECSFDDIDADKCKIYEMGKNYGITVKAYSGERMFSLNSMMIGVQDFINILQKLKTAKN